MHELFTVLIAALPISELRGSIPLAIGAFGFGPLKTYMLSVVGNLLPLAPWYVFLKYGSDWLMRKSYFFNLLLTGLFSYTRNRHGGKFGVHAFHHHRHWAPVFRAVALAVFVAIPLPGTGAWTGVLIAFLFGIPFWEAMIVNASGVFVAGLIVLGISLGVFHGLL